MEALVVPASVRRKLGDEASEGLVEVFGLYHEQRLNDSSGDWPTRFPACGLRCIKAFAAIRHEMTVGHVAWLRWSFLFWIGQVAALAGLLAIMLPPAGG